MLVYLFFNELKPFFSFAGSIGLTFQSLDYVSQNKTAMALMLFHTQVNSELMSELASETYIKQSLTNFSIQQTMCYPK